MTMDLIVDFPQPNNDYPNNRPHVSFADRLEVKLVYDISYEHRDDLWFSDSELKFFKKQMSYMIKYAVQLNTGVTSSSFAGLEKYLTKTSSREEIVRLRQTLRKAILLEQERQFNEGIDDPDKLARISEALTEWSRINARVIGLMHHI